MRAYTFNPETLQFMYEFEITKDPLDNRWLVPPDTTTVAPPQIKDGQICVYNKKQNRWEVIPDFRGVWYVKETGTERTIDTIYDTSLNALSDRVRYNYEFAVLKLADGTNLVRENPNNHQSMLPFECLEWSFHNKRYEIKKDTTELIKYIKKTLASYKDEVCKTNIGIGEHQFQTDDTSLAEMSKIIISNFGKSDNKIGWQCADNNIIDMNVGILQELYSGIINRNEEIYIAYQNFRNKLEMCKTIAEIEALFPNYLEWLQFRNKSYGEEYDWKLHMGYEPYIKIFDDILKKYAKLDIELPQSSILSDEEIDKLIDELEGDDTETETISEAESANETEPTNEVETADEVGTSTEVESTEQPNDTQTTNTNTEELE